MSRSIAIAAAVFALGLAVSTPRAAEMTLPGSAIGSAALAESEPARGEEATAPGGAHATGAGDTARPARSHLHPDSAAESRETVPRAVGGEGADTAAPKARHRGGAGAWQALLPGVMK